MKAAHGGEVVGEGVGVSGLQLLNQKLDVGGDEFLFSIGLLAVDDGEGCDGHGGFSLVLAAALSVLKRGMYMPNATWRRGGSKAQGEGSPHPWREPEAEWKGRSAAEVCTSEARKIGETPCAARSGQSP